MEWYNSRKKSNAHSPPFQPNSLQKDNALSTVQNTRKESLESEVDTLQIIRESLIIPSEDAVVNEPITVNVIKPKKELPKQSSLGAMMKDIHQEVISDKEDKRIELTEESVQTLWKDFLKDNKERLQNAFLTVAEKQTPQLADEKITFTETNNISLELLQLHKMDIVSFYRKKTTTVTINLEFKLNRTNTTNKIFKTPKERLKDMIEANPSVLSLIQKFDLNNE